jgi:hypothetical protein
LEDALYKSWFRHVKGKGLGFNRGNLKLDFWVADDLICLTCSM